MKKMPVVLAVFLVVIILFAAGCNSNSADDNKVTEQNATGPGNQGQPPGRGNDRNAPGNAGDMQRADLMGEVSEIADNTISIKLIEQPEPGINRDQNRGETPPDNKEQDTQPQSPRESEDRTTRYTGETKTLTISADIPITINVRGQNQDGTNQIKISEVQKGDILQIWYSDKENEVVSRINVSRVMSGT